MRKRFQAALFFLLFGSPALFALDISSDFYTSMNDFFFDLYGTDSNAGLTAFPVLNIPMGGRSEGMAGAFSAVCDDISFVEWNPAGSSMLFRTELAFYHNNWIADTKIESAIFSSRLGNFGLAAAGKWLYTPFTEYGDWGERLSKGYYSEIAGVLNVSYNFFPGYYFSGISVGLNVKAAYRAMPDFSEYTGASQSAAGFMGDAGLLTRINFLKFYDSRDKNTSFAFVLRNIGPAVMGDALPSLAVAAISYRPFRPLLFSFDFSLPVNLTDITLSEKPFFAFGFSAAITRFLSMRTGLQLKAGASRFTLGTSISLGAAALEINYSLDLATQLQPLNRVTLGVRLDLGDGGRAEVARMVDSYYLNGLDAYSEGDDEKALENFSEALKINPNFDPAIEGIEAIENFRSLTDRIKRMEELDL